MNWFRFYTEVLNDPKVQSLPDKTFKAWVNCLCVAGQNNGYLGRLSDLSFQLRLMESETQKMFQELKSCGLVEQKKGKWKIHNWSKRQYKSDTSTERVKRFRNAKKPVTVTPPETDTEQIQNRVEKEDKEKDNLGALRLKYLSLNIDDEHEKFTDHCKANGKTYKDYNAAFRNWCKNALKYQQEKNNGIKQSIGYGIRPGKSEQAKLAVARGLKAFGVEG